MSCLSFYVRLRCLSTKRDRTSLGIFRAPLLSCTIRIIPCTAVAGEDEMRTANRKVVFKSILVGSLTLLLLLSSCRKQAARSEPPAANPAGPQDPELNVSPAGYHGKHFTGPIYIPRSSPMEDGTTAYNVTYQDGVTVLSKDDTMHHLVSIDRDGNYIFDSSARQIAKLSSGSVLLLSGLALRTVVDVQKTGAGYMLKTAPALITDAIKDGRLEGTYKIDFSRMQARRSASLRQWLPSRFSPFGTVYAAGRETTVASGVVEFDVDFSGYNYHVKFTPGNDRIDVQATIKFGGSQGKLAYEGAGYLSNFVSTVKMQIKDGKLTSLNFTNSNLTGQAELKWYAVATNDMKSGAMAKITSWPAELVKSALLSKAAYHIPILVGAVPFDLRISLGFSFIPAFTSKNSVVEGSKLIKYSGSGGFNLSNGKTSPSGSLDVQGSVTTHDNRVLAVGPVGFTAATEAPRLELTLGWPPATAPVAGYLNFVASYGIVTNGMVSPIPCQTNIMAFSVNAGSTYTSPNTFATWLGMATGASSSVSLWSKTIKSAGAGGIMCPS